MKDLNNQTDFTKEELQFLVDAMSNSKNVDFIKLKKIYDKSFLSKNNKELYEKMKKAKTREERLKLIEGSTLEKNGNEKDLISKIYDVDISKIKIEKLKNGTEIIKFYSDKLKKLVCLEKDKNSNTLTEELKKIQEENILYQGNDSTKNTNNILEDERVKNKCNLELVPIKKLYEYRNEIEKLNDLDKQKFYFLLDNSSKFHIEYINIQKVFGVSNIDYNGETFEAIYDEQEKEFSIQNPKNEKELETEKKTEEIEEEILYSEKEIEQAKIYIKYPELLNALSFDEQEKYKKIIEYVNKENEKERNLENKNAKVYVYKSDSWKKTNAAYINIVLSALLSGFLTGIVTAYIVNLIK